MDFFLENMGIFAKSLAFFEKVIYNLDNNEKED